MVLVLIHQKNSDVYQEPILNGAGPELDDEMIPITISNTGEVKTVDKLSSNWYSYANKQWANAVLVKSNGTKIRDYYKKNPNETIAESDILAYFVWIPKFSYKLNGKEQPISISFNSKPTDYITPPAFDFEDGMLGYWVGKFETGHVTYSNQDATHLLACTNENCDKADGMIIKPNVKARGNERVASMFFASRSMERDGNPYGFVLENIDVHMMKNSEWSAVTFLIHSEYGINKEVRMNTSTNYTTGCGATEHNGAAVTSCDQAYGSISSGEYPQSTTGNITGIFDMAGGSNEYVMAWNSSANTNYATSPNNYFGYTSTSNTAGFTSKPEDKYWDDYATSDPLTACNGTACIGHGFNETKEWYSDFGGMAAPEYPWFCRGGYNSF